MREKNVLAILGSPHENGTTAAMLNLAVHKTEKAGYAVTKINLYEKELSFPYWFDFFGGLSEKCGRL